ncbi:MAG: sugar transferase [Candidatus Caldatribacteriaceae bacterium]
MEALVMRGGWYRAYGKRILDVVIALLACVILSPVILGLAVVVYFALGKPMLFRQIRPGLYGKPFVLYKFRTMLDLQDETGNLLPDGKRLTRVGRFLRRTSLDELPEFWNVLRGEMGLVGPRPLLMEYLTLYTPEQARRHEVKPGITGLAAVRGRNLLDWEEKFRLDVWYVDHLSFWLDMQILFLTVWKVLKGEGISSPSHVTVPKFEGTKR